MVALTLMLVGGPLGSRAAFADAFGYPNPGFVADGADHWFCYSSVPSADQFYIAEGMGYLDDATDMYDVYTSSCGTATDIIWVPGNLNGARGQAVCARWISQGVCDQYWALYDVTEIYNETLWCVGANADNFYANFRKTLRHELGHTAGLSHGGSNGCGTPYGNDSMVSGWVPTSVLYVSYNGHHISHINVQY